MSGAITWNERIDNYVRVTKFPRAMTAMGPDYAFGFWRMGNDYRVKSGYHGGYPNTYLRRVRALFPEKQSALHVFSGKVDLDAFPGETVDINSGLCPTYVDDAQRLLHVPLDRYDIVLCDPPYANEDAYRYGTTMVRRSTVMEALTRVNRGTHIVWLDMTMPQYRKDDWTVEADIGIRRSSNHRFRCVTVFRRS